MRHQLLVWTFIVALTPAVGQVNPWFDGQPEYRDSASQALAEKLLSAHGGMEPWRQAQSLQFRFFTKMLNGPMPFYSFEAIDLTSGAAYIDWLLFDSTVGWDTRDLWSVNWPMPLPPGFFVHLTSTFITLPWQIQSHGAVAGPVSVASLPDDDRVFDVLRIEFDQRGPHVPGTYYDVYVDRETGLMKAIGFDINHPGMVANPQQPLGPNLHVFGEYRRVDGLVLPTFYQSYGQGSAAGGKSNAYHFAWDIRLDQPFDATRLERPEGAVTDEVSLHWWSEREITAATGEAP